MRITPLSPIKQNIKYNMRGIMQHPNDIKQIIESHLQSTTAYVSGDGHHFDAIIVSALFEGLSRLQRQQAVYAKIGEYITNGTIHALSFKTLTPEEWAKTQEKLT